MTPSFSQCATCWGFQEVIVKEVALESKNAKILVVEDNADSRDILAKLLRMSGYDVSSASDGESGLSAAVAELPDLIITDINMPGMDGIELLKKIRRERSFDGTAVLVVTAFGEDAVREAIEAGADASAAKPFDFDSFIANVHDVISKRRQEA